MRGECRLARGLGPPARVHEGAPDTPVLPPSSLYNRCAALPPVGIDSFFLASSVHAPWDRGLQPDVRITVTAALLVVPTPGIVIDRDQVQADVLGKRAELR